MRMKAAKKTVRTRPQKMTVSAPSVAKNDPVYDTDFSKWVKDQAKFLRKFEEAYSYARLKAAKETRLILDKFPEKCPWTLNEIFPDLEKKYCS